MAAGHRKLANLTLIIDRNTLAAGRAHRGHNDVEPLADKWRAFRLGRRRGRRPRPGGLLDASRRAPIAQSRCA